MSGALSPRRCAADDPTRPDLDAVWRFPSTEAYRGRWREFDDFRRQVRHAWRVVGCYDPHGETVGFARAFSDGVAMAYLADVYIETAHRGRALGRGLVHEMIDNGPGKNFKWMLHTDDAHELYRDFGFAEPNARYLERQPSYHSGSGSV
ncbi:GNAT family N-acetyltransferase [Actinopolyspora mzabensis]|uniref:GNAT family N-acetyltransferase n=1 Tax=Actinopolyspora mzabensis TaxID=995066 RepID=UPI000B80832B|nr:GNAT family N-acetyltransferase [Actinopolyspora mzabensis]